jgi:hypothetical protein
MSDIETLLFQYDRLLVLYQKGIVLNEQIIAQNEQIMAQNNYSSDILKEISIKGANKKPPTKNLMEDYISAHDAAKMLDCTPETLRHTYRDKGKIPFMSVSGRIFTYHLPSIIKFIADHTSPIPCVK